MTANIRNLKFHGTFRNDLGPVSDEQLLILIHQFWPEHVSEGSRGQAMFGNAEEAAQLTALFEAFGCNADAAESSFSFVGEAYDMFALHLAPYVERRLRHPNNFRAFVPEWPQDWHDYIVAVAARDTTNAQRLFAKLQPLDPATPLPPGCPARGSFKPRS